MEIKSCTTFKIVRRFLFGDTNAVFYMPSFRSLGFGYGDAGKEKSEAIKPTSKEYSNMSLSFLFSLCEYEELLGLQQNGG